MLKNVSIVVLAMAILPLGKANGTIFRDEFTTSFNYATGSVPIGGIWNGIHNGNAGGTGTTANSTNPGQLTMGLSGVGWENSNDTGPMLYRNVTASDFVRVTAKITSQTQGNWSLSGVF